MPICWRSLRVTRAFGSANSRRSVRIPHRGQSTRRCGYTSVTGCAAQGRSSHVRSRADRTRLVRRPQPLHGYRRGPRRSIRIRSRLSAAASSPSTCSTRNPGSPRIHVQSRCDPTRPPWLQHNKRERHRVVRSQVGSHLSTSRPPSRPPTPPSVRAGGRVLPLIPVRKIGEQPTVLAGFVIQLSVVSLFDSLILFGG